MMFEKTDDVIALVSCPLKAGFHEKKLVDVSNLASY